MNLPGSKAKLIRNITVRGGKMHRFNIFLDLAPQFEHSDRKDSIEE